MGVARQPRRHEELALHGSLPARNAHGKHCGVADRGSLVTSRSSPRSRQLPRDLRSVHYLTCRLRGLGPQRGGSMTLDREMADAYLTALYTVSPEDADKMEAWYEN